MLKCEKKEVRKINTGSEITNAEKEKIGRTSAEQKEQQDERTIEGDEEKDRDVTTSKLTGKQVEQEDDMDPKGNEVIMVQNGATWQRNQKSGMQKYKID